MPLLAEVRSGGYPATKNVPMKNTVCALLKYKKSCEKYKNIAALIVEKCEIKKKTHILYAEKRRIRALFI